MNLPIYLDNASTTFPYKECLQFFQDNNSYYNASNLYNPALDLKEEIEYSREHILSLLNAKEGTIIFTSGGCEGNNTVIKNLILFNQNKDCIPHIITSQIEHHSVLNPLRQMESLGLCEVTYLKPSKEGKILKEMVKKALQKNTVLISIMSANNELGTVNPIVDIGMLAKKHNVLFHTDATQLIGKDVCYRVIFEHADYVTFSAHKFHGPKGVGGLYVKDINTMQPFISGGNQEFNLRAGTYNYPAIKGMEIALEMSKAKENMDETFSINFYIAQELKKRFGDNVLINGESCHIPILNFSLKNCEGEAISMQLADAQIYTSNGSACNTGSLEPSYVLKAIDCPDEFIYGAIRISWDSDISMDQIDYFLDKLEEIYKSYEVKNE